MKAEIYTSVTCTVLAGATSLRMVIQLSSRAGLQADRLRHLAKYFATMLELEAVAPNRHAADVHT